MSASSGNHVLVVDDCEPLRYLKAHFLFEAGFHVSQAGTGRAAFESIEANCPDLVLLDVNLPDIHGSEVCREIKTRWALPVICTSSIDIPIELQGVADGCLVSLDEQDLLAAVRTALHQRPSSPCNARPAGVSAGLQCWERSSAQEISAQARNFESGTVNRVLNASAVPLVVLNREREIIFCNSAALSLAGIASLPAALGLRVCEAFHCTHATQSPQRGRKAEACQTCSGGRSRRECSRNETWHIERSRDGVEVTDHLTMTASSVEGQEEFVVCTLTDFSVEKQRRAMEVQFFHDILNLAAGVKGSAEILREGLEGGANTEIAGLMAQTASELLSEINGQQQFLGAEAGELRVKPAFVQTLELIQTTVAEYQGRADCQDREILIDPRSEDLRMETDPAILSRVFGNMLKNALAATQPGGTVTVSCEANSSGIEFCVHDRGVIPEPARFQIFQRPFSRQGSGRALRNYSIKLMTERYLDGTIRFESSPLHGTRFIAQYPNSIRTAGEEPLGKAG